MNTERRTMNKRNWLLSMTALMTALAYCLLLNASTGFAAVPHLVRYQGTAVDAKGVPIEGPYVLTFRLYSAETAGTKLWEETQPNVPLSKGYFSVLLGQVTPLNTFDWSQPRWLAVQVNAEPELTPRQRITSVPLAIMAERLADDQALVPAGAVMAFNRSSCPAGWSPLAAAVGRVIVGGGTVGTTVGTPLSNGGTRLLTQVPQHGHVVRIMDTNPHVVDALTGSGYVPGASGQPLYGGLATSGYMDPPSGRGITTGYTGVAGGVDVSMPYLQLLMCEKN